MQIYVEGIAVSPDGSETVYGGETGTPAFYMVHDTLIKHLQGDEVEVEVEVNWDYNKWCFIITQKQKQKRDATADIVQIIESIYEPFAPFNLVFHKDDHLKFKIISK